MSDNISIPTLYLLPSPLSNAPFSEILPPLNIEITSHLRHFIVEDVRTARRFLRTLDSKFPIDDSLFFELNKRTPPTEVVKMLAPMENGYSMGVISEAGCPAVADPGAVIVALAQDRGYRVRPLVGPSSILLALMASGFNGQQFTFRGYLPIDGSERIAMLRKLEREVETEGTTQIFIETPYRNNKILEDICRHCKSHTRLCIAGHITAADADIRTRTVKQWAAEHPEINKVPTIFLIGK